MCYRTKLNAKLKEIEKAFAARFTYPDFYSPMEEINAFTFPRTPVIINENRGEIDHFHWGLIPAWAKDSNIRNKTLNARIETVRENMFKNSVENRCLVIASAYYEWQWLDSKGKEKKKFLIQPKDDQEIFAFAGIYSSWKNPSNNQLINTYSIITTVANELMAEIHNNKKRMPVILKKEDREIWLSGGEITNFAFPYEVELEAREI